MQLLRVLIGSLDRLYPFWLARVISLVLILRHSIGHVWYIIIPTWLRGFQDKPLYLVLFSLYPGVERQKELKRFRILTQKPRSHARIPIWYQTRPIENCSKLPKRSTLSLDWVFSSFCYLLLINNLSSFHHFINVVNLLFIQYLFFSDI